MIRALFGGSFDPIHAGHVAVVDLLQQRGLADRVHVVPAWRSPLKPERCVASAADRLELARLLLAGHAGVELDDREALRPAPTYTVETLATLVADYPEDRWRLVVGADHVPLFHRWHEPERLLDLAEVSVVARGPVTLMPPLEERARVIEDFDHPAEASRIRCALAAGIIPGPEILPAPVAEAIVARGLYGWPAPEETS